MPSSAEQDLRTYEIQQAAEARLESWKLAQSDALAEEWEDELSQLGRITALDLDERGLAVVMERRGLDREDTITALAFELIEKMYGQSAWD